MQATGARGGLKRLKEINNAPTPCVAKLIITLTVAGGTEAKHKWLLCGSESKKYPQKHGLLCMRKGVNFQKSCCYYKKRRRGIKRSLHYIQVDWIAKLAVELWVSGVNP